MMENLYDILKHIYPDLDIGLYGAVQLVDLSDGLGPRISVWNDPRPQPTQEELLAANIFAKRNIVKNKIDELTAIKIASIFNLEPKSNDLIIKQLNYSARASELQEILITTGVLSPNEQTELNSIKTIWNTIKTLREHGKQLKIALDSANPATFDITVGW